MDGAGAGTAIMLAVAAALWFLYFVPTWLRRREYLATERTATRLQQTIRVMAEAAEVPTEVRIAATAREAARQERLWRAEQRRADAMTARQLATVPASATAPDLDALRRRRMRRTRLGASLVLLSATVVLGVQVWLVATTGMSLGAFFVFVAGIAAGGSSIAVQRRLDALAMPLGSTPARVRNAVQVHEYDAPRAQPAPWTPVEVPRPLYLSRPAPESLSVRSDLAESLRAAAAASEAALREAQHAPEVAPLRTMPRTAPGTAPSKYARMGVLGPDATATPDVDEALRRRRSAG